MRPSEPTGPGTVTRLLRMADDGDPSAHDVLYRVAYDELRTIGVGRLRHERPEHTLQPTALVHELYLKMAGAPMSVRGRTHFIGLAVRSMRQIVVDHARRKGAAKRGGDVVHTTLGDEKLPAPMDRLELFDLDRAMEG
ncbi:MAG: ECF-type sigma factor [Longimicrobiales bacterium]|nr:ECF-type sigma factor [Longimicrobiales bacterium]